MMLYLALISIVAAFADSHRRRALFVAASLHFACVYICVLQNRFIQFMGYFWLCSILVWLHFCQIIHAICAAYTPIDFKSYNFWAQNKVQHVKTNVFYWILAFWRDEKWKPISHRDVKPIQNSDAIEMILKNWHTWARQDTTVILFRSIFHCTNTLDFVFQLQSLLKQ